jgi:RNA polymerase sigma factor (sigma-70 family)
MHLFFDILIPKGNYKEEYYVMNIQTRKSAWFSSIAELEASYRATYRSLLEAKERAAAFEERDLICDMMSDVQYAIEWMRTGTVPGHRRGIERRATCQREQLTDPCLLPLYAERHCTHPHASIITHEQRQHLENALCVLSARERECFELHYGTGYSYHDIAALLGLKKGTVQYYVQTGQKKLYQITNCRPLRLPPNSERK